MSNMKNNTSRQKRVKTGNWRPFRPEGMSDGAWRTILLLHRYPSDEMSEEEQSHCLGPMLFGKGGARFGDYGRGWIQEQADALLNKGKTPYAMDARGWHDEIVAAIDYYNGMGFDEDVADFWYKICYGPYGEGPWRVMTDGVLNGWKDVFTCDENEAFYRTTDFDWRCAALCDDSGALDVQLMAEICPVCPNAAIFGGIDCACDMLKEGKLDTRMERKLVRYLKRAFGELYKRRNAVGKNVRDPMPFLSFDRWLRERKCWAVDRYGDAACPDNDIVECPRASDIVFEDVEEYAKQAKAEQEDLLRRFMESMKKRNADRNAKQGK